MPVSMTMTPEFHVRITPGFVKELQHPKYRFSTFSILVVRLFKLSMRRGFSISGVNGLFFNPSFFQYRGVEGGGCGGG